MMMLRLEEVTKLIERGCEKSVLIEVKFPSKIQTFAKKMLCCNECFLLHQSSSH